MATKTKKTAVAASLEDIGSAAGAVWQVLDAGGAMLADTARLKSGLPVNVFYAGLGWLAREGKLTVAGSGKSLKIGLP